MRKIESVIAVTADEYELPLGEAETPRKLEKMMNLKKGTVASAVHSGASGSRTGVRFYYIYSE